MERRDRRCQVSTQEKPQRRGGQSRVAQKKQASRSPAGGRRGRSQGRTCQARPPRPSTRRADGARAIFHAAPPRVRSEEARQREIRERARISGRLVVFSVHTGKVAYQDLVRGQTGPVLSDCPQWNVCSVCKMALEVLLIRFDLQTPGG